MTNHLSLKSYALFAGVSDEDIAFLSTLLNLKSYGDGAYLFWQDDLADRLFLIQQGAVEILNQVPGGAQVRVAVRQEGDSIGEMALIDTHRRSASVRAIEPVTVFWLSSESLEHIRQTNKDLYICLLTNIAREISSRLSSMDTVISGSLFGCSETERLVK
ncbi:cyclic nucleotide-binding domain-containing protein [Motiliproteus sp. MSK22-1]|uniref:cyclic nucleotide-binding domain-containing protein n=1 Tax=Motiliproteus sp. MSK22-1 TaxID=1897630 RepID=UPI000975F601|nr:cyclic nucleotide-binding domain-containing protein [Motiliproteus sp. MSK22-1]OMH33605.1 hypothetical protein BGP75_11320 [Motiliproteus sp. MSK22-1]